MKRKRNSSHDKIEIPILGITIMDSGKPVDVDIRILDLYINSLKQREKFKNSPQIAAIDELCERLENGTATEEERRKHEIWLKRYHSIPDNVIDDDFGSGSEMDQLEDFLAEHEEIRQLLEAEAPGEWIIPPPPREG